MDHDRFDSLTRMLSSRRAVNGAIAGAVAGLLGLARPGEAAAGPCPKGKKRCGKRCIPKKGCCTSAQCKPRGSGQVCRKHRCVCPAGTKRCRKRCLPRAAACPPKPDASCLPVGVLQTRSFYPIVRMAQTFTEPNGGRLLAADVWVSNYELGPIGTYELRVTTVSPATGAPEATTLALALHPAADVSTAFNWVHFTFPAPPLLRPGQHYALVLTMLDPIVAEEGWKTQWRDSDPCPGGTLFFANGSAPFIPEPGSGLYRTYVKS